MDPKNPWKNLYRGLIVDQGQVKKGITPKRHGKKKHMDFVPKSRKIKLKILRLENLRLKFEIEHFEVENFEIEIFEIEIFEMY